MVDSNIAFQCRLEEDVVGGERDMEIVARASASGGMILGLVRSACQWLGRPESFATTV